MPAPNIPIYYDFKFLYLIPCKFKLNPNPNYPENSQPQKTPPRYHGHFLSKLYKNTTNNCPLVLPDNQTFIYCLSLIIYT